MNKLIILLKQLNIIDQVSILMHANLKKVVVHQNNEYSFYIESKDFIPFEEYQLLINSGDQFPYPIEFIFNYPDNFSYEQDWSYYLGYIIEKMKLLSPLFTSLKIEDIEINQVIKIGVLNEIQLEQYQQLQNRIKQLFKEIGLNKSFQFYIKEDVAELESLLQEMDSYEPVEIDLADFKKAEAPKPKFDYKNNYRHEKEKQLF